MKLNLTPDLLHQLANIDDATFGTLYKKACKAHKSWFSSKSRFTKLPGDTPAEKILHFLQHDHGDDDEEGLKFIFVKTLLNYLINPDDTDTDHLDILCFTPEDTDDIRDKKIKHILWTAQIALLCITHGPNYRDADDRSLVEITLESKHTNSTTYDSSRNLAAAHELEHTFSNPAYEDALFFLMTEGIELHSTYTCKIEAPDGRTHCEKQSTPLADIALANPDLLDALINHHNGASIYTDNFHQTLIVLGRIQSPPIRRMAQAQLRKLLAQLPETFDQIAFCEGLMTANGNQFDLEALPMLIKALQCDDTLHHCLQLAAWCMHEELIVRLMDVGADPHALNSKGDSALSLAAHDYGRRISKHTYIFYNGQNSYFKKEKAPIISNECIYVMLDHPSFTYQQDTAAAVLHAIPRWKQETEMMWEPGKAELLKILLTGMDQAGVFTNISPTLDDYPINGKNGLQTATDSGHPESIRLFLSRDANPLQRFDNTHSALIIAYLNTKKDDADEKQCEALVIVIEHLTRQIKPEGQLTWRDYLNTIFTPPLDLEACFDDDALQACKDQLHELYDFSDEDFLITLKLDVCRQIFITQARQGPPLKYLNLDEVKDDIATLENATAGASTSAAGPSLTTDPTDTVRKTFLEGLLLCFRKQSKKLISLAEGAAMFATRRDGGGHGLVAGSPQADKVNHRLGRDL